jgi:tRNA1Val (adenine37-N6)-methyltransferase
VASAQEVASDADLVDAARADALFRGRLPLLQPRRGYRTNVDALWLAAFARRDRTARRCLDLGAGVGAVGLALVVAGAVERVTLLDVDAPLLALARKNAISAGVDARVETLTVDLAHDLPREIAHGFDLVVANPPYGVVGEARSSPHPQRARARTGDRSTLSCFARAARFSLGAAGRACFVFPAHDLSRLFDALAATGLVPKRMRVVHPLPDAPAKVALVEAKPARPGGLRVEPPFIAMRAPGVWSEEAVRILDGGL